jgi:hypothetical protein
MPRTTPLSARCTLMPLIALGCVACTEPSSRDPRFTAELRAMSTSGEAIADVRFWADGRELGTTGSDGALHVALSAEHDDTVSLTAACPPAYRTLMQNRRLVLRRIEGRTGHATSDFELTARCEPLERLAAVVVRARGPAVAGLPIRVDGETLGQTDLDGTAHLLVKARPHSSVRVAILTSEHADLLPRDPVQTFQLDDEDSILLVDQDFMTQAKRAARASVPRLQPAPPLPYRIHSH